MAEPYRSQDVFEQVEGYPRPPLPPLPDLDDLDSLAAFDIVPDAFVRRLTRRVMKWTGFEAFHRELPGQIEGLLRRTNLRLPGLYAPLISATLALADDPRQPDPLERAAQLVLAARSLWDDLQCARLPADTFRGQPLEMGQYFNLFATCLVIENGRVKMFKSDCTGAITVVAGRRLYRLEIGEIGRPLSPQALRQALAEIAEDARRRPLPLGEPAPGLLTAASNPVQQRAFTRLAADPAGAAALEALRNSFLTVCLELDTRPSSAPEAARLAHAGNCANRWYHASLQLIIFGSGAACALCNFTTYLDGNTMMRAASELQSRAAALPLLAEAEAAGRAGPALPPARELVLHIPLKSARLARRDLDLILDPQAVTFELPGLGREAFTSRGLDPVPTFMLALMLAAYRSSGQVPRITQFLTMSRYACMALNQATITTPACEALVKALDGGQLQPGEARQALLQAIESQVCACREARRSMPMPELFMLYLRSLAPGRQRRVMALFGLTILLFRLTGRFQHQVDDIIVSHPEIYANIPVVGRPGVRLPYVRYYGLHYQILPGRTVLTLMPSLIYPVPNGETVESIRRALETIFAVLN